MTEVAIEAALPPPPLPPAAADKAAVYSRHTLAIFGILTLALTIIVGALAFGFPDHFISTQLLPIVFWLLLLALTNIIAVAIWVRPQATSNPVWLLTHECIAALQFLIATVFYAMLQEPLTVVFCVWNIVICLLATFILSTTSYSAGEPRRLYMHFIKWFFLLIWSFTLLMLVVHAGMRQGIQRQFPPTGQFYSTSVSSNVLLECQGFGSPTVVLESGLGVYRKTAYHDQYHDLTQMTRVCWYDRPGYGYSGPLVGSVESISAVSKNLWELLERAGEQAPFVVVGNGLGGIYVRDFAMNHAANVSGIMLIDSMSGYEPPFPQFLADQGGVGNAFAPFSMQPLGGPNDDVVHVLNDRYMKAIVSEAIGSVGVGVYGGGESVAFLRKADMFGNGFGSIPLTVLTAGGTVNASCYGKSTGACSDLSSLPLNEQSITSLGTLVYTQVPVVPLSDALKWSRDSSLLSLDRLWEIYPTSGRDIMNSSPQQVLLRMKELVQRSRAYSGNSSSVRS
ncbi:UNVERIFIED_CONTAM: hypothetical protein HDU68_008928 [Siphonaria sp. JEL0065]|nr:hypothetical protein HDU68_008928 [Siphonaria sp. JEL0065]